MRICVNGEKHHFHFSLFLLLTLYFPKNGIKKLALYVMGWSEAMILLFFLLLGNMGKGANVTLECSYKKSKQAGAELGQAQVKLDDIV